MLRYTQTVCVLLTLLINYTVADCMWKTQDYNESPYCGRSISYEAFCFSTVTYNLPTCKTVVENEIYEMATYERDLVINLNNPNENPFLEEVTSYVKLTITDGLLVTIPMNVFEMIKLTDLTVTGNNLRKINLIDFLPLVNLNTICLAKNEIRLIETIGVSDNYSHIRDLDLSLNFITTLPDNFVRRYKDLQRLNVSYNTISSIGKEAFEGAINLESLDISHNKLHEIRNLLSNIPKHIDFNYESNNLGKLSKLFVDNNLITYLNFTHILETDISQLGIGGNQISCNLLSDIKYSNLSEQFNSVVTAISLNYHLENVNGIPCHEDLNIPSDVFPIKTIKRYGA